MTNLIIEPGHHLPTIDNNSGAISTGSHLESCCPRSSSPPKERSLSYPLVTPDISYNLPLFITSSETTRQEKLKWAEGLRGLAAFMVAIHHGVAAFYPASAFLPTDEGVVHIWQRPFIRAILAPQVSSIPILYSSAA